MRSSTLLSLLSLVRVAAAAAPPLPGACAFYVSPSGDDSAPGTLAAPFRTLARAASALRGVPRPLAAPTLACLRGGRYSEALSLTAADSGSSLEAPAGFSAAFAGEEPVELVGSVPVAFAPLAPGDPGWAHLPAGVGARVLVASLPDAGLPNASAWGAWVPQGGYHGCAGPPLELLAGAGAAQVPARWPNAAPAPGGWATTVPSWRTAADRFEAGRNASFLGWTDAADVWFHGHWWWDWNDYYLPSGGWDAATGVVRVAAPLPSGNLSGAARYYALGSLCALDAEGEYHLNRSSGALYWLPPAGADPRAASVSLLPTLISGAGVSNFYVGGLSLWGSRGTAVDFSGGANVSVVNCTVAHAGLHGIVVGGSGGGALVAGNVVRGTGGRGVSVASAAPRAQLAPSGDRVADNVVHDFERVCLTYAFGVAAEGPGVVVERNEVFNSGHACATIQGNNALFRWNVLHHCTMDTFDNAALYWYPNDWTRWNVTVSENFFYLNGFAATPCNFRTSCLRASAYMDNAGAGASMWGNVIWQPLPGSPFPVDAWHSAPKWVAINNDGGRDTAIVNNLVVDAANTTYNSGGGLAWPSFGQLDNSSALYAAMRAVNWSGGAFAAAYPRLAALQDFVAPAPRCRDNPRCPPAPFGNAVARNVVVNASGVILMPPGEGVFDTANFNVSNNLFNVDPRFVEGDPRAALNFELAPDSPAYTALDPPFQRIRRECFGPWSGCA